MLRLVLGGIPNLARASTTSVRLSEVVSALSYALDITEGQPQGHAVRTCLIGMRLGAVVRLTDQERSALFYALLLKDLGCSSNAARLWSLFGADDLTGLLRGLFDDDVRRSCALERDDRIRVPLAAAIVQERGWPSRT